MDEQLVPSLEGNLCVNCSLEDVTKLCAILVDSGYKVEITMMEPKGNISYNPNPVFQIKFALFWR